MNQIKKDSPIVCISLLDQAEGEEDLEAKLKLVKKVADETAGTEVRRLITEKKDLLDKLASELFTKEVLLKDDIEKIIGPREPYFE